MSQTEVIIGFQNQAQKDEHMRALHSMAVRHNPHFILDVEYKAGINEPCYCHFYRMFPEAKFVSISAYSGQLLDDIDIYLTNNKLLVLARDLLAGKPIYQFFGPMSAFFEIFYIQDIDTLDKKALVYLSDYLLHKAL